MLMVVYCHIMTFIFKTQENATFILLERIMLPIFFFISGYIAFKKEQQYIPLKYIRTRFLDLLLPTCVCWGIYVLTFNRSLISDALDLFKGGYWFTIVLFEMLVIAVFILKLQNRLSLKGFTILLCVLLLLSNLLLKLIFWGNLNNNTYIRLFSLTQFVHYFPYFLFGMIFKFNHDTMWRLVNNQYVQFISFVGFIGLFLSANPNFQFIQTFLGVIVVLLIFHNQSSFFNSKHRIGNWFCTIGRYTKQIYFLHYFVIFGMIINLPQYLPTTLTFIQIPIIELILVAFLVWIIVELCIIGVQLIKPFTLINSILFGFKK